MKAIIIVIVLLLPALSYAQIYEKNVLFHEDFLSGNVNKWEINDSIYSSKIDKHAYVCSLPVNNEKDWTWTFVSFPDTIQNLFNISDQVTMDFVYENIHIKQDQSFALMFDLHDTTATCEGGDFYAIKFEVNNNKKVIKPHFFSTSDCNAVVTFNKDGDEVALKEANKISISKTGLNWEVLVNGVPALVIHLDGKITLDELQYGLGAYRFKDFTISSTTALVSRAAPDTSANFVDSGTAKIWALCVGIDSYKKYPGKLNTLKSAIADAKSYYEFLGSDCGGAVPVAQRKLIQGDAATRDQILTEAGKLFSHAGNKDLVIIFLAGHGVYGAYCANDGPLLYKDINLLLTDRSKAARKLLIADACRSGSWATSKELFTTRGQQYTREQALKIFYDQLTASGKNVNYLLAAQPDEFSYEYPGDKHGIFTFYLLAGLKGYTAKTQNYDYISLGEVANYVSNKVTADTQGQIDQYGVPLPPQHPYLNADAQVAMPIAPICP